MFQFTRLLLTCLWIQQTAVGYPGIIACLSAPPGFSQTSTPFSFRRQGIPHVPFVIWPSKSRTQIGLASEDCEPTGKPVGTSPPTLNREPVRSIGRITNDITCCSATSRTPISRPTVMASHRILANLVSRPIRHTRANARVRQTGRQRFSRTCLLDTRNSAHRPKPVDGPNLPRDRPCPLETESQLPSVVLFQMPTTKQPNFQRTNSRHALRAMPRVAAGKQPDDASPAASGR